MGSCVRRFLTHGGATVYDCLCLSSCTDEERTDHVAILPSTCHSHLAAILHIHDTV